MNDFAAMAIVICTVLGFCWVLVTLIRAAAGDFPRAAVTRRPCWSDAPDWAWYLMQGSDGGWIWLEKNPAQGGVTAGRHLPAVVYESYRLERRPK